jgi:DNA (cytosine-5)-methyltransferase 1
MRADPIAVDLFAGAGGLSLGFEQAGFAIRAAVEYDPIHCATHEFNFPNCAAICRSVTDIDGDYVRSHSEIGDRDIDVVVGGAPCQGFSLIGKRALDDPRNNLIFHFLRIVQELQPKYFVLENVRGLTIGHHRRFLHEVIEEFKALGYLVLEPYRVLNALWFGVPQDRQRLFLLGARKGLPLPVYPQPTHRPKHDAVADLQGLQPTPTVWEAIGDLPEVEEYEELLESDSTLARFGKPTAYARRLRDSSRPNSRGLRLVTASLRTIHTPESQKRFRTTPYGCVERISRFLKLDPDGYCNTLRAGTASDRGAFTSPRPIHPHTARCITVREAARLHSYPDWFRFHVTKWHGFRQIGNSVPPLLAQNVANEILRALRRNRTEPIEAVTPRLGDISLLSLDMSQAAERYGVPAHTIPRRRRNVDVAYV